LDAFADGSRALRWLPNPREALAAVSSLKIKDILDLFGIIHPARAGLSGEYLQRSQVHPEVLVAFGFPMRAVIRGASLRLH